MGIHEVMQKGIFLDRDGVINKLVYHSKTGEYEPPHKVEEVEIFPWVFDAISRLKRMNFSLFLISNQPDCAKGKASMEDLISVHSYIKKQLDDNNLSFNEYYYCYHHPNGINSEYRIDCECRKPKPYFVLSAVEKYNLSKNESWFVGDRDSDVQCGQNAGVHTILIEEEFSKNNRGKSNPDFYSANLADAVRIIEKLHKGEKNEIN